MPYDPFRSAPQSSFGSLFGEPETDSSYVYGANGLAPAGPGQIDWIAAINGQTPEQYLAAQRNASLPPGQPSAYDQWWQQQTDPSGSGVGRATWNQQQQGQQTINQLNTQFDAANTGQGWIYDQIGQNNQNVLGQAAWLGQANQQLAQRATDSAQWANAQDASSLGTFNSNLANIGAWDQSNIGAFSAAANAPMQMFASPYVGDAYSNPEDVARQMQVFNQLQGAAGGSLDVTSRAAQAYASAGDIANQQRAARTLEDAGAGALDVNLDAIPELSKLRDPDSIGGMRTLMEVYDGSQDVAVGQLDPEAYQAAVDTRNKLWGLTDPSVTAQEKLMFELSRQQQEQDERSVREALATDAARRGVGGQGTEIARSALAAQQTSRNRMLQDMQANAQAQARAIDALAGHGTLATNMTAQANQLALANQQTRMNALGQYTDVSANAANVLGQLGAANATNNMNRRMTAEQAAYAAYANLRAQGFSEEYARGQAADVVAMSNSDRRLGAMNSSASLASSMRQSGDAMNMFNQSQRQQQSQFSDTFHANREDAAYGRQRDLFTANNTIGNNMRTDNNSAFDASTFVTGRTDARNQAAVQTQRGLNNDWVGATQGAVGLANSGLGQQSGIIQTQLGNNQAKAGTNLSWGAQQTQDAIRLQQQGQQNVARWQAGQALGAQDPSMPGYNDGYIFDPRYPLGRG